jgi:hypothetical protein
MSAGTQQSIVTLRRFFMMRGISFILHKVRPALQCDAYIHQGKAVLLRHVDGLDVAGIAKKIQAVYCVGLAPVPRLGVALLVEHGRDKTRDAPLKNAESHSR